MSEAVLERFDRELKRLEREKNLKALLLGTIDEDEIPNPTLDDMRAIRKIFVSRDAIKEVEALSSKLGKVGCADSDDPFCMTTSIDSLEYYAIFKSANRKMKGSYNKRKYKECMNRLLAVIMGLKNYQSGFFDTEDSDIAQGILNKTCIVWRDMMGLDANAIGLENEDAKKVLFEVMDAIEDDMVEMEYTMDIGEYRPVRMRRNHNNNDDSSDDDSDNDGNSDSNHNRNGSQRRRRRRRRQRESDDEDEPRRRRRRLTTHDDEYKDDEVEAYTMSELQGKKVNDLKELLRDQHFPVSGNKQTLIDRLLYPLRTILEMKKGYHNKQSARRGCWVPQGTSQREVNAIIRRANVFNSSNYVFKNGKIKEVCRISINL